MVDTQTFEMDDQRAAVLVPSTRRLFSATRVRLESGTRARSVVDDVVRTAAGVVVDPLQTEGVNVSATVSRLPRPRGGRSGRSGSRTRRNEAAIARQKLIAADFRRADSP
jgi:hypothetical protein